MLAERRTVIQKVTGKMLNVCRLCVGPASVIGLIALASRTQEKSVLTG